MLGAQTGRLGARETFARRYQEIDPTPEEVREVDLRLSKAIKAVSSVMEEQGISSGEILAAVLSAATHEMGQTKREEGQSYEQDEMNSVMFETISLASAGVRMAITDHIVTEIRSKNENQ